MNQGTSYQSQIAQVFILTYIYETLLSPIEKALG